MLGQPEFSPEVYLKAFKSSLRLISESTDETLTRKAKAIELLENVTVERMRAAWEAVNAKDVEAIKVHHRVSTFQQASSTMLQVNNELCDFTTASESQNSQTAVPTVKMTTTVPAQTAARKSRLTFTPFCRTTSQKTTSVPAPLDTQPLAESSSTSAAAAQTDARKSRLTFVPKHHTTSRTTTSMPASLDTQSKAGSSSSRTKAPVAPKTTLSKQKANVVGLRLPEPWRSLMELAKALHLGQSIEIPPMSDISHLSPLRKSLFKCAYDNINAFKFDKKLTICQKDAHVALSLTLNLSSPEATDYFHGDDISSAMGSYNLNITENRTSHILGPLQNILEENDVEYLQEEVCILKGQYQQQKRQGVPTPLLWKPILDIIEHLRIATDILEHFEVVD
ncbi:hypothetical protein BGX27_001964 [Mortierella sp. AM989]|nr:hypothetical protein BGX27_001964 [Mortierella sp. AM989]